MPGHWGVVPALCLGGDTCSWSVQTNALHATPVTRAIRLYKIILTRLPKEKMKLDVACRPGAIAFLISTPGRAAAGIYPVTGLPKRRPRGRCSPLPCPNAVVIVYSASSCCPLPHSHPIDTLGRIIAPRSTPRCLLWHPYYRLHPQCRPGYLQRRWRSSTRY